LIATAEFTAANRVRRNFYYFAKSSGLGWMQATRLGLRH